MNAQQFLERIAETADAPRLDAHTNLVSKDVSVFGVPGFDVIGRNGRYNGCKHAFENKRLKLVSYRGRNILADTPDRIMFTSMETVENIDRRAIARGVDFIIQKVDEGAWRVSL